MARPPARDVRTPRPTGQIRRILARLEAQHPDADTELRYTNAFELLVATILSAQCTDARVNQATPELFRRFPDAPALARATVQRLEPLIRSTGFFRAKARTLVAVAAALTERHGGRVPADRAALVELPGVGRKTANVVLGHAFDIPACPVDRHVLRVANRLGIAHSDEADAMERRLCATLPRQEWIRASDTLILHGRRVCRPRPACDRCAVADACDFNRAGPTAPAGHAGSSGRAMPGRRAPTRSRRS